jgi:tetratricopeptide (TPR) repeat protein/predicted Ser/Thr protein kinase
LELPAAERREFVARECADHPALKEELSRLLAAEAEAADFLAPPTLNFSGHAFGSYEAIEEIGRGGMSVVYKGRRRDGDFEKLVAIKILLLHPDQNLQTSETQILAGLEHPNIARLLDSGSTASGFRFLVMEYVDGVPCPQYAANLNLDQKLRLFLAICRAVQFSHQSLVVHRDLKPANILVTADGTAKLLDFGIAKLLRSDAALNQTHGIRAYTPDYASPEQILGGAVTTASDVYSLGALLCELVSGRPPRQLNTLSTADLVAEVQRDALPQLPFAGDLSAIAQKALRRLPSERYPSASELANDVERFLNQEPVSAQVPTWAYRTRKFMRRHRLAVAAAALVAISLATTTGLAIWQAREATRRFEQVQRLAESLLFEIHDAVAPLPGSITASKLITDRSVEYLDEIARDRRASLDLQLKVVRGYLRLAVLAGIHVGGRSMGNSAAGQVLSQKGLEVARRLASIYPSSPAAQGSLADALLHVSLSKQFRGLDKEALIGFEEAVQIATKLNDAEPEKQAAQERLANSLKQAAGPMFRLKMQEKGMQTLKQALHLRQKVYEAAPNSALALQAVAESYLDMASRYLAARDFESFPAYALEAYRLNELRYRQDPRKGRLPFSASIGNLAMAATHQKKYPEAIRLYKQMASIRREITDDDPGDVNAKVRYAIALDRIGYTYSLAGQFPEAILNGEEALKLLRKLHLVDPQNRNITTEFLYALGDLSKSYDLAKRLDRACPLIREFFDNFNRLSESSQVPLKRQLDRFTAQQQRCR